MNIGIITPLTTDKKAGIGVYTSKVVEHLQKLDSSNTYYVFTFSGNRHMFSLESDGFNEVLIKLGNKVNSRNYFRLKYFFWHIFFLPYWSWKLDLDVIHIPSTWFIYSNGLLPKQIVTIHDLAEFHTTRYGKLLSGIKKNMVHKSIKNSDGIVTVSEFSKSEIKKLGGGDVYHIYNGFNCDTPTVIKEGQYFLKKLGLKKDGYFLFVGTMQKHKNIPALIRAFYKFRKDNNNIKLVLAGKEDNGIDEIKLLIQKSDLQCEILRLGYITDEEKYTLISNALALLFLSKYEGFGLPVLEAQKLRTPVIISDTTALPEIAGDGALQVDCNDTTQIAEAMSLLMNRPALRRELVYKGELNLSRFSWEKCAQEHLELFNSFGSVNFSKNFSVSHQASFN